MISLSGLGIGLSLVFGCLLLALVAELYYLLWWKKRISNREIEDDYSSPAREFLHIFCWKKPSSFSSTAQNPRQLSSSSFSSSSSLRITHSSHLHEPQALFHLHPNKDLGLENLSGPPRFLFSIKEETKEDLESEDGKSRGGGGDDDKSRKGSRCRSLSTDQLLLTLVETPFLTPIASPPYFTPPLTPQHHRHGFVGSSSLGDDEECFCRIWSSPPPKLKFLKDAEDKLYKRKMAEEVDQKRVGNKIDGSVQGWTKAPPSPSECLKDEENGPFITLNINC
ncbi:hypothetical protein U1Q18_022160 [Sarracenia purpurea var. burkii]